MNIKQIEYGGWSTCHALANGVIRLVVTGEVGPRIMYLGFADDANEFYEDPAVLGQTGGDEWKLYGGHRFWHAPEVIPRTYHPDNQPVIVEEHDGFVRVIQPVETGTGIVKEMDISMTDNAAHVHIVHRLRNKGVWPVELAPWALTVMATGGTAIIPLPPRGTHAENLLPTNTLTMWAYTDLSDPRWTWGERYILLRQDTEATKPQKIGSTGQDGWIGYARNGHLFLKLFEAIDGARYPDMGCAIETFTNDFMLEMETLGPLSTLEPDSTVEHAEDWFLFPNVKTPQNDEDVDAHILPLVHRARNPL